MFDFNLIIGLQQYLVVDGEEIFKKLSYMSLFIVIKEFIKVTKNNDND